jgi:hypothetical protein
MLSTGCWFSDQRPFFLHPGWLFLRSLQEQPAKERISKEKRNHQAAAGVENSEAEQKAS